jgi:hypothetical protein
VKLGILATGRCNLGPHEAVFGSLAVPIPGFGYVPVVPLAANEPQIDGAPGKVAMGGWGRW